MVGGYKACSYCGVEKPESDYNKCSRSADLLQGNCRACNSLRNKANYAAKKEDYRKRHAEWRAANRLKHNANSSKWYFENKERRTETALRWRADNPEFGRAAASKRRLLERQYEGQHYTGADVAALLEAQKGLCIYCNAALNGVYHVDHITPLSKGGSNGPENICITCPPCNMSKHGRILGYEWCECGAAQGGRYK